MYSGKEIICAGEHRSSSKAEHTLTKSEVYYCLTEGRRPECGYLVSALREAEQAKRASYIDFPILLRKF